MKKLKMLLAVLLTLSMVLGMASVVMAADGSSSDPYVLGTDSMISFSANGTVYVEYDNSYAWNVSLCGSEGDSWTVEYGDGPVECSAYGVADFIIDEGGSRMFGITNTSGSTGFIVVIANEVEDVHDGTETDPIILKPDATTGEAWLQGAATIGDEGLYYKYTAPKAGLLAVDMKGLTYDYEGEGYEYKACEYTVKKGAEVIKSESCEDEKETHINLFEVKKDDVITVYVKPLEAGANAINFGIKYPSDGEYEQNAIAVVPGKEYKTTAWKKTYFAYTAAEAVTLKMTLSSEAGWTYEIGDDVVSSISGESQTVSMNLSAGQTVNIKVYWYIDEEGNAFDAKPITVKFSDGTEVVEDPTDDVTTEAPAEDVTTAAPAEDVTTAAPAEDVTTAAPAEDNGSVPGGVSTSVKIVLVVAMLAAGVILVVKKRSAEA